MEKFSKDIKQYAKIGIALSAEKNISRLLEMIVDEARELSGADAGTLYVLNKDKKSLRFEVMQNNTLNKRIGGTSDIKVNLPDVALYHNGKSNFTNVSSYVALTGTTVNIPDVYTVKEFNLSGTRKYDKSTGYRSQSMLVIPLKNHENAIIGVLQLLNPLDPETGKVVRFSKDHEELTASLASQAAVALTNTQLIQDLKKLFYAFIKSIATTIDEKSPYTGGHIKRVVNLTMAIADEINKTDQGPLKDIHFNEDEIEELRIAAWMHDVGKVTTPEYVVDKSTRLESISDRINLIETRFGLIEASFEKETLEQKYYMLQKNENNEETFKQLDMKLSQRLNKLRNDLNFIKDCNIDDSMDDTKIERLKKISKRTYFHGNNTYPYLTENELLNLSIKKGTLLENERKVIENHVAMTLKITNELPFPEKLSRVPEYAGGHHEKLNGSGYPKGIGGRDLPWQSRIMAIADIFEALTAKDRPYKKPMNISKAIQILNRMKDNNEIDPDIYDLFLKTQLHKKYAQRELSPEQNDDPVEGEDHGTSVKKAN